MISLIYILNILSARDKVINQEMKYPYASNSLTYLNNSRIIKNNESSDKIRSISRDADDWYGLKQTSKYIHGSEDLYRRFNKSTDSSEQDFERIYSSLRYMNRNMEKDERDITILQNSVISREPSSCRIVGYTEKDSKNVVSLDSDIDNSFNSPLNLSSVSILSKYASKGDISTDNITKNLNFDDFSVTKEFEFNGKLANHRDSKIIENSLILKKSKLLDEPSNISDLKDEYLIGSNLKYDRKNSDIHRSQSFKCNSGVFDDSVSIAESYNSSCTEGSYLVGSSLYNDNFSEPSERIGRGLSSSGSYWKGSSFEESLYDIRNSRKSSFSSLNSKRSLTNLPVLEKEDTNSLNLERETNNSLNLEITLLDKKSSCLRTDIKLNSRDVYNTINEILRTLLNDYTQFKEFIKLVKIYIKKTRKSNFGTNIKYWFGINKKEIKRLLQELFENNDPMDLLIQSEKIFLYHNDDYVKIMIILKNSATEKSKEIVINEGKYSISLHYLIMHTLLNYINKKLN